VIVLLRFIGVMNAAVWFGASVFFTFVAAPALFTPEMKKLLGDIYPGLVAQMILERYFALHYWCAGIALLHLAAETFYLGKTLPRFTLALLIGLLAIGLTGGCWLQPKLKRLHQIKYGRNELYSPAQKEQATAAFKVGHGFSWGLNLLALGGLGLYVWRVTSSGNGPRFIPSGKFRG
jgi:Domain of unknown function (DUF4149)